MHTSSEVTSDQVFQDGEFIQGKPVFLSSSAAGPFENDNSTSNATFGPRGSPDAASSSEGSGQTNSCKRAPFLIELFCGTAGVCARSFVRWAEEPWVSTTI